MDSGANEMLQMLYDGKQEGWIALGECQYDRV